MILEAATPIGEKIALARFERYDVGSATQTVGTYIHRTDFKTGVMVEVATDKPVSDSAVLETLAREVAMHVAAAKPAYVSREDVPSELIEQEREIALAKAKADPKFDSKPEQAQTAMIEGQVRKFLEGTVLLDQAFVRDPSGKQRIGHLVADASKQLDAEVSIVRFACYRVGETQTASGGDGAENA
jgi:elongation factor Ts